VNNIRYVSATKIGEWERDKMCRFCLLTGDDSPYVWDFGSAAVHHQRYSDWLEPDHCLAGVVGMRGTIPPEFGLMRKYAKMIAQLIKDAGMADMPVGVDYAETAMFHALQEEGIKVVDGQQIMLGAREIKNWDEIQLLTQAASMVDGVYHMIYEELKPGVRENDIVALSNKLLYEMGSDDVEAINAISGERCNPHPHNFTDRLFRPGDQAFFDILQSYQGYRTCYYRTFNIGRATPAQNDAYVKAREWIDASIAMIKPGVTTDKVAEVWPTAESLGFPERGRGLRSAIRPRPRPCAARAADHLPRGRSIIRWRSRPAWSSRSKPTARRRRLFRGADRGRGRRDRDRAAR
jgi:Xaa-Pro aminopeptidase